MTRRYDPENDDRVVRHLFQCMLSDEQIADRLSVSPSAIPPARARMGLGRPKGKQPIGKQEDDSAPPGGDQNKPLALARVTLQGRLEFKPDHIRLDGKPTTLQDVLIEANRVRVICGEEQVGHEVPRMKRSFRYRGAYLTRVQFARIVWKRQQERGKR